MGGEAPAGPGAALTSRTLILSQEPRGSSEAWSGSRGGSTRLEPEVVSLGWQVSPGTSDPSTPPRRCRRSRGPSPRVAPSAQANYLPKIKEAGGEVHHGLQPAGVPAMTYRLLLLP